MMLTSQLLASSLLLAELGSGHREKLDPLISCCGGFYLLVLDILTIKLRPLQLTYRRTICMS